MRNPLTQLLMPLVLAFGICTGTGLAQTGTTPKQSPPTPSTAANTNKTKTPKKDNQTPLFIPRKFDEPGSGTAFDNCQVSGNIQLYTQRPRKLVSEGDVTVECDSLQFNIAAADGKGVTRAVVTYLSPAGYPIDLVFADESRLIPEQKTPTRRPAMFDRPFFGSQTLKTAGNVSVRSIGLGPGFYMQVDAAQVKGKGPASLLRAHYQRSFRNNGPTLSVDVRGYHVFKSSQDGLGVTATVKGKFAKGKNASWFVSGATAGDENGRIDMLRGGAQADTGLLRKPVTAYVNAAFLQNRQRSIAAEAGLIMVFYTRARGNMQGPLKFSGFARVGSSSRGPIEIQFGLAVGF